MTPDSPDLSRRRFIVATAAAAAARQIDLASRSRRPDAMTDVLTEVEPVVANPDIRAFHVTFTDAELADLKRRVEQTRWPDKETVNDASQGVQLATMQALASYWATQHDWRKIEARLNSLPQFITN